MTDSVLKQMENYCYTSFKREHEYSDAFGGLVSAGVQNQGRYCEYVQLSLIAAAFCELAN